VKVTGPGSAAFWFIACACATAPAVVHPQSDAGDCALIPEPGDPVQTVALVDRVDPANAPWPSNDSERLVFRQLYETLVTADCHGRAVPALASSWRLEADGRTWSVTLRDAARFSDGTEVTPAAVRAAWSRDASGNDLRPHVSRLVQSIAVTGDHALAIVLRSRRTDAPMALAHPDLSIGKSVEGTPWPLGTKDARVSSGAITVVRDPRPPIRFVVATGDPRDMLDRGVDLLVTREPAALGYAATLPQFQSLPLAWQRTHVLITSGRSRSAPALSEEQRQGLAADAVRGEARGARAPFWWETVPDCELSPAPRRNPPPPTPRIVYDAGDSAARDLAERLVGLGRFQRAAGLRGSSLALARRQGADAGYIVAIDSQPLDACRDLQMLAEGSRWLDPGTIVPLVETRLRAIVRRGRSGLTTEWDGGIVIAGVSSTSRP
jgi:hypothetical protein